MNVQERDLLNQLLKQLAEVKITEKDAEAETLIREAASKQPDATYLLTQRVLLLEHALNVAKAQNDELQAQLHNNNASQKSGFLSNDPWAQQTGNTSRQAPHYAAQPQPQTSGSVFGGGSSFLGNMATTAAGVVAGSFLFQGIENLMGHHSLGFGQQSFAEPLAEKTVVNNYYGDDAGQLADNDNNSDTFLANDDFDSYQDDSVNSDWT
jgi:uncharacterized protein